MKEKKTDDQATIGLEVHVELATKTKMFCGSINDPDETHPNVNVCPVCMAHPGTLPVINKEAVRQLLRVGLAFDGEIAAYARFDRKNYFYPDLPKGYQISQYEHPFVTKASLALTSGKVIRIRRIHLEEDTAALIHDPQRAMSFVDFNRAGIPLMELVTEPDFSSAAEVREFGEEFQRLLRYVGASRARMEKSELRMEANVSLAMGTKVELKNIGSFYAIERAVAYEVERQRALLADGGTVRHETRGWDEAAERTFSQRSKEEAHDYRYFPEPDLPPLRPHEMFDLAALRASLPELPWAKRARLIKEYTLDDEAVRILVDDPMLIDFFEQAVSECAAWAKAGRIQNASAAQKLLRNYLLTDLLGLLKEKNQHIADARITPENFAELMFMILSNAVSSRGAKDLLRFMIESGGDPSELARERALLQVSDKDALRDVAQRIVATNPGPVKDYRAGKEQALQFLVGQMMKETKGAANPQVAAELLTEIIKEE